MVITIYDEIRSERTAQDIKWGGAKHDDTHTTHDWVAYICKHLGKAVIWPFKWDIFRTQMIRVAALAVAATEWVDRHTYENAAQESGEAAKRGGINGGHKPPTAAATPLCRGCGAVIDNIYCDDCRRRLSS